MKTKTKAWLYYVSAILVLLSTALYITQWSYAPYLFAFGSAGIATFYFTTPYEGDNIRLKRLHRFEVYAAVLMVATSYLMFKHQKEWILSLSIAAFLQLYTTIICSLEEKKEKKQP